ncbi:uncharacterized protein LOC116249662 [Nymphaea colorata]|nr:uncharacterized protein LOC116249662 [Nymphaea colorata]
MDRKLRSSISRSPEEFLSLAVNLHTKPEKSTLRTLIFSLTSSSACVASLPAALFAAIQRSIDASQETGEQPLDMDPPTPSPPTAKRLRRSSRSRSRSRTSAYSNNSESENPLHSLQICASIIRFCVSHPNRIFSLDDLLPCVQALHDHLVLFESDSALQVTIASLCEEWWKLGLPGKETLISQSLPFLLATSLCAGRKSAVRRVYLLRDAFTLFDFLDDSIEDLKILLLRCVITPIYLRTEEGKKFLSFLFGLNVQLVKEVLAMIRSQIPFGRKSVLESLSEVVFWGWKAVEGQAKDEVENGFLQALIEAAVHASSKTFASSIRRLLGGFISQRMMVGVEKLLFRLSEPILFRSLQAANSNVRQNALILLVELFPLEDPDATKEVKDNLLNRQFFLMEKLLFDDCPDVRASAVEGVCRVLCLYWEIIPPSITTKMLTKLFDDLSHDVCSNVRLSVLNGILYLLTNAQSHEVLKVLLPKLGHALQDPVLSVRVAACDLLLAIRDASSIQFCKVIGVEMLFHHLANDHALVAEKITRLLIPSYFPLQVPTEEACAKCLELIKRSPCSGEKFCEYAFSQGLCSESLLELVRFFCASALSSEATDSGDRECLIIAASKICISLSGDPSLKKAIHKVFLGRKFKDFLKAAVTPRARTSVLNIATLFSPPDVVEALKYCVSLVMEVADVSENSERQDEVRVAHQLIFSCGLFDEMFGALVDQLQQLVPENLFNSDLNTTKSYATHTKGKKVKLSRKVPFNWNSVKVRPPSKSHQIAEVPVLASSAAWQIKDLLASKHTRVAILVSPLLDLACSVLKIISQVAIERYLHSKLLEISCVEAYMALTLHMALEDKNTTGTHKHNKNEDCDSDSTLTSLGEGARISHALSHLLACLEKAFVDWQDSGSSCPSGRKKKKRGKLSCKIRKRKPLADVSNLEEGAGTDPVLSKDRSLSNIAKLGTAIIRFIVDATALNLVFNVHEKCLQFVSAYLHFLNSLLRRHSGLNKQFKDDYRKEVLLYIRSSFTYAAKLLNLLLLNSSNLVLPKASSVAGELLDLIATTEVKLSSSYAAQLVNLIKGWLPDLVLALVSEYYELAEVQNEKVPNMVPNGSQDFRVWLEVVAKLELKEHFEGEHDEDALHRVDIAGSEGACTFKKLISLLVVLLKKGDAKVLEAFIIIIMSSLRTVLDRKEYGLALGYIYFLCVKLDNCEDVVRGEHRLMLSSIKKSYNQIENELENLSPSLNAEQKLQRVKACLESICVSSIL